MIFTVFLSFIRFNKSISGDRRNIIFTIFFNLI